MSLNDDAMSALALGSASKQRQHARAGPVRLAKHVVRIVALGHDGDFGNSKDRCLSALHSSADDVSRAQEVEIPKGVGVSRAVAGKHCVAQIAGHRRARPQARAELDDVIVNPEPERSGEADGGDSDGTWMESGLAHTPRSLLAESLTRPPVRSFGGVAERSRMEAALWGAVMDALVSDGAEMLEHAPAKRRMGKQSATKWRAE